MDGYKVIAKDDLVLENDFHSWTKGQIYSVIQADTHIKIETNQGQINYVNEVKNDVLKEFEVIR